MPTFPYVQKKKLPSDLLNAENGKLDLRSLASLSIGAIDKQSWDTYNHKGYPGNYPIWQGHKLAVAAVELMIKAAAFDKIDLRVQGGYRPYSEQDSSFHLRYTDKRPNEKKWNKQAKAGRQAGRVGRLDEFAKVFKGKTYWLKTGDESPVALPGFSNHGLGIAFDLQFGFNKNPGAVKAFEWVRQNAFAFGFYWDTGHKSDPGWEDWHLTYCFGDDYGCLPLIGGGDIIPAPLSKLNIPAPPSKRLGRAIEKMARQTPPVVEPFSPSWKWWIPQSIDWYDTNKAFTLVPLGGFIPNNPPSAV